MSTTDAIPSGPPAKRRVMEGFAPPGGTTYPVTIPHPDSQNKHIVSPTSQAPDSPTFLFNFKTNFNQMIRFPPEPFIIYYDVKVKNEKYNRGVGVPFDAQNENHYEYLYARPQDGGFPYYIPPLLGGRALLSKLDVSIDNISIKESDLVADPHWTVINKKYCSDAVRRETYADKLCWASHCGEVAYTAGAEAIEAVPARPGFQKVGDAEVLVMPADAALAQQFQDWGTPKVDADGYVPARPFWRHKTLEQLQRSVTFDGTAKSAPNVMTCGFDGFFPVGGQNNILRQLYKIKIDNYYLKKSTDFSFTAHRRIPVLSLMERADVSDDDYFSGNPLAKPKDVKVEIRSVFLMYESFIAHDEKIWRPFMTNKYEVDQVGFAQRHLTPNTLVDSHEIGIPAGTNFIAVVFLHENQIRDQAVENSFISCTRYTCVPDLDEFEMSFPGKENLLFHRGLKGLGHYGGRSEPSVRAYYNDLVRRNVYAKTWDHFFPPHEAGKTPKPRSYDCVIFGDTGSTPLSQITDLRINLKYRRSSPSKWFIRVYYTHQRVFKWNEQSRWTWADLPLGSR